MVRIAKTNANLEKVANDCEMFMDNMESEERAEFGWELEKCRYSWNRLIGSRIFRMAFGYVVKDTDLYVFVNED